MDDVDDACRKSIHVEIHRQRHSGLGVGVVNKHAVIKTLPLVT